MPAEKHPNNSVYKAWEEFAERHHGHPHLAHDPLDSLPERLIDHLADEIPDFFDDQEEAFERDLAKTTGGGLFFRGRVVSCLLLARPVAEVAEALDRQLNDLMTEYVEGRETIERPLDEFDERRAEQEDRADVRAAGYAGWLVSNPMFLAERDELRDREGLNVEAHDGFPSLPRSFLGKSSGAADRAEGQFYLFHRRWNLDSFLTWDLPLPLLPEFGVTTLDTFTLAGAGITLFLPWYVAQDGLFSPDELVAHLKSLHQPSHLAGWLAAPAGGGKGIGDVRYQHYLALYRYWRLVLERRYADRLHRRTMLLDRVFAAYRGCDPDSIKKVRIAVNRAAAADAD